MWVGVFGSWFVAEEMSAVLVRRVKAAAFQMNPATAVAPYAQVRAAQTIHGSHL